MHDYALQHICPDDVLRSSFILRFINTSKIGNYTFQQMLGVCRTSLVSLGWLVPVGGMRFGMCDD
jgi:hypothetical protein